MSADRAAERTRLRRSDVKVISVATLGWSVDMFDLMMVLNIAPQVAAAFFPSSNALLGLTATYASFAISLVVRPIGSLVFGALADRAGRRRSMTIAVLGAGVATALMGVLPGAVSVGVAAPIGVILLRIVQGVFVGGITASTHTLATETVPEGYRGLTAGVIKGGGASLAVALINVIIIALDAAIGPAAFDAWGWRLLFGFALVGSVINYLLLRTTEESPLWRRAQAARAAAPAGTPRHPGRALFTTRWRGLVITSMVIVFTASAPYYLTTGILPTVYKEVFGLDQDVASSFVIINVVGSALVAAVCGHLSQHVGRKKVFLYSGAACLVLIPGLYGVLLAAGAPGTAAVLASSAVMVMASGATTSPLIIFLNERFPTEIRSTATAFTWNIGYGLSGMVPTFVTGVSGSSAAILPTLIVTSLVVVAVFLATVAWTTETRGALTGGATGPSADHPVSAHSQA